MNHGSCCHKAIFIEPSSEHFAQDRLFDVGNESLNRDGTLLPFFRLKQYFEENGVPVHTADYLRSNEFCAQENHYWSLGVCSGYQSFLGRRDVRLKGFVLMEPPLVKPKMYGLLPELTSCFDAVYVHNIHGDGYSLRNVDRKKLRTFHWPQPYAEEVEPHWSRGGRLNKLVVVAGHHHSKFRKPEYYSKRIEAVGALADLDAIDLFGRGWDRWWAKESVWWPYWRHRSALMKAYRGSCASKLEVLSRYRFSLCYENMPMAGYLTEKIFDCLYAGTVPVYLGAPDIAELLPSDAYVDMREFPDYDSMLEAVRSMSDARWQEMREAGRAFLRGQGRSLYYDSLIRLMED